MLPSTGYFKTINCPFYENGSCDRPYCHFKHARREDAGGTAGVVGVVETQAAVQSNKTKTTTGSTNNDMLQQLVTAAVKKVLADQEVADTEKFSKTIVSQVVEGLKTSSSPTVLENTTTNVIGKHISIPTPITKPVPCVYNPTPIAELKKRHIPVVSYMPTRETRVAVKRKSSPEGLKPWLSVTQEPSASQPTEVTYKPTAIVNAPDQDAGQSYTPMFKSDSSSSNSYEDSNSNDYVPKMKEAYYPRSKKRREEYVPMKVKAPLKNQSPVVEQIDETVLDQFDQEFDMIDEILTAAHTGPSAPPSEESQDYCYGVEPKFSDDEPMEDSTETLNKEDKDHDDKIHDSDPADEEESEDHYSEVINETKETIKDQKSNHCIEIKPPSDRNKSKEDSRSHSNKEKPKDKVKDDDKTKKGHRSSSKNHEKDKKEHSSSGKSSKDSQKHKSSSSDRRHSSSHSKDRDKSKSSHSSKDSSHKSREHSHTHKHKDSHSEKDRKDRQKSSKHDKHKSRSSSSKSKDEKHASDKKHHSRKHHSRSTHRSSTSSRRSSKHKESSSERNTSDHEQRSNSPTESIPSLIDEDFLAASDSDHDVQEECLKIFQEYEVSDHPKVVSIKQSPKREAEEPEDVGRKRVAHPSAASSVTKLVGPSQPRKKIISSQQKMYERWRLMREAAAEKAAEKAAEMAKATAPAPSLMTTSVNMREKAESTAPEVQLNGSARVRIAHVPYAKSLTGEKKNVAETSTKSENKPADKTVAQTSKGARVAHVPVVIPNLIRPEPLQVATQKFSLNVRQDHVNLMHDICVQIYTNGEDAAERAVREEFACHERCKALSVYKNSCMLAAHRLRKELADQSSSDGPATASSGLVSHEAVLAGKSKGSWSVVKSRKSITDFKGAALYGMLKKWILTEEQLRDNGFPRPHPDGSKGRAKVYVINSRNQTILSKVPNERYCNRCGATYMVNKQGLAVQQQNCIYHWGRKFTYRGESKYSCCQQYGSASGCCDAKTHVWDYTDYENLRGYVRTLPKDNIAAEEQGVFALDCEMCYTTQGLELTRVTVINEDCNVIYETLVKPMNPIIDYNTRFSGITEETMKDVTTTLLDVQATLLVMFSEKTILVGHSLESDFKALRLLHDTVVDTSIMFPHKNGYPQKRALKNLCSEYLRKIIQNDVGGHDSKEDAVACMDLVRWKVKEEAKLQ